MCCSVAAEPAAQPGGRDSIGLEVHNLGGNGQRVMSGATT